MTENIKHGFWHYFEGKHWEKPIEYFEEYKGQENLVMGCTQLGTTAKIQNAAIDKWCEAFRSGNLKIKKLWFVSRISQKIFDAICELKGLDGLWIKWGVYPDISNIEKLKDLEYLHLGSGSSIESLDPIKGLRKLKSLETNHLYKITDYSFLTAFRNLVDLSIEGDPYSAMKKVTLSSLKFLEEMPQLVRLNLTMTKIEDHSYLPILKIKSLKYLSLPGNDKDLDKDIHLFEKFIKKDK